MWGAIAGFVMALIGPLVGYVIKALGIGLVTYVGLDLVFDQVESYIFSQYAGLPVAIVQILNLLGIHSGIKIILSTLSACVGYKALINSTGLVWKKPGSPPVKSF
jgi:hypothetical protein